MAGGRICAGERLVQDAGLRGRVFAPDGMLKLVFDRESTKILGVHIIGTDACELVHYGMDLVAKEATLFDVIGTLFTAVTFHELFKEAALNGNEKLEFGIQWQEVLSELSAQLKSGELKHLESVTHGLESAVPAFIGMLKGENFGKTIVQFD